MAEGGSPGYQNESQDSVNIKDDVVGDINIPFAGNFAPDEQDDVKILKPIAKLTNFFRLDKAKTIIDMKWVLNDTFLVIITSDNQIIFFDVLLKVFSMQSKFSEIEENRLF